MLIKDRYKITISTFMKLMLGIPFLVHCGHEKGILPELFDGKLSFVTDTTAIFEGKVYFDGGSEVTARGVCWSSSTSPATVDNKTIDGKGAGEYKSRLTGLASNTIYYLRAYAINSSGTAYGSEKSFKTQEGSAGTVIDIEGNIYNTVIIGTQIWMTENLKTTKFNDGEDITLVTDGKEWAIKNSPAYCWFNNATGNKSLYGAIYNFFAVGTGKLCPVGWKVPTESEVTTFVEYLGVERAGIKIRESGNTHWDKCSPWSLSESTNESGFNALGGGCREAWPDGNFCNLNSTGAWWTSTNSADSFAIVFHTGACDDNIYISPDDEKDGKSVRCMRE